MEDKKLSIIIPAYNGKNTILEILRRIDLVALNLKKEIIIIDDCSDDGTAEILKRLDVNKYKTILKSKNEGKGSAIKIGLLHATGEFVIFQDADLEYDPNDYKKIISPLEKSTADVVIGSRVLSGSMQLFGSKRVSFVTYCSCKIVVFLINFLYGRDFTDCWGCYKAFRRDVLSEVKVGANGFEYEIELLCKLLKRKIRMIEVPISYHPRGYLEGKKISFWPDAFLVIFSVIKSVL